MEKFDIPNETYVCGSELQIATEISHRYSPQNGIFTVLHRNGTYMNWYGSSHEYYHYLRSQYPENCYMLGDECVIHVANTNAGIFCEDTRITPMQAETGMYLHGSQYEKVPKILS